MTSYADQRIETIKQQVMSRTTLWKIVDQDRLYERMRRGSSTEDVIERFIKDINIDVISADRGRQADATSDAGDDCFYTFL